MFSNIANYIKQKKIRLVIVDVDGTLKDLAAEHTVVIEKMCQFRQNLKNKNKYRRIIWFNKFFMSFAKCGLFIVNKGMQMILCFINSIMFGEPFIEFKQEYFGLYNSTMRTFKNSYKFINLILSTEAECIIVSKNKQNVNFFNGRCIFQIKPTIIINDAGSKINSFKQAVNSVSANCDDNILPEQILIIGDNFWDDIIPAMSFGSIVWWCNKYNSKLKKISNFFLCKMFYKKAIENKEGNSIW